MSESAGPEVGRFIESGVFAADPIPWLLASREPYTVWAVLAELVAADAAAVEDARTLVLADLDVAELIGGLSSPDSGESADHHSPLFLPNRLNLLADMGVGPGDDERVEESLDRLLSRQTPEGGFAPFGRGSSTRAQAGDPVACETAAITEVLLRFGRGADPRVERAMASVLDNVHNTSQGSGWRCPAEADGSSRPLGRRTDACPQVTLEALRVISHLPERERPPWALKVARTPPEIWRRRTDERPCMFGHGFQFKSVKWPNYGYDVLSVLETVGRYPGVWRGASALDEDRRSLTEMAACLVAYNFEEGREPRVTPRRVDPFFERFSFGQKTKASPFATARALIALARFADLAEEIAAVDVLALPSSTGGSGSPLPPSGGRAELTCRTAPALSYAAERVLPRVLTRHHLDVAWEPASIESVVADVVALPATHMSSAYVALQARLPGFTKGVLDDALYSRRSLVRFRGMRGVLYVVRRDLLPVVFGATNRAVVRYARRLAEASGLTAERYEAIAPRVIEALADRPLSSRELRECLGRGLRELGAVLTLMSAEGLLLRDRPPRGWLDRQSVWTPLSVALPDVRLDTLDELDARSRLLVAYIRAFGPATMRDAAWWTGISPEHVRRTVNRLEDEIVQVRLTDSDDLYLMHAADAEELERATLLSSPAVSLLPPFDPLLMGYANRSRLLDDSVRPYVFDESGNSTSTIIADGRVVGVWEAQGAAVDENGAPKAEPRLLAHLVDRQPARVLDAVEARAAALARFWFDAEVPVVFQSRMEPLGKPSGGSVLRPLSSSSQQ